jgi:hypothetical protein
VPEPAPEPELEPTPEPEPAAESDLGALVMAGVEIGTSVNLAGEDGAPLIDGYVAALRENLATAGYLEQEGGAFLRPYLLAFRERDDGVKRLRCKLWVYPSRFSKEGARDFNWAVKLSSEDRAAHAAECANKAVLFMKQALPPKP